MLLLAAMLLAAPSALAQSAHVEGFDGGSNEGNWSWGTGNQTISPLNGNPGAYLQDLTLFTAQPTLRTEPGVASAFTGDYVASKVTSIGVDLITLGKQFPVEGNRFVTLVLLDDNGTPGNPNDDRGAYFVSDDLVPDAGVPIDAPAGWTSYDFAVDADSATLPDGWQPISFGAPGIEWPALMADVDMVEFWYGAPGTIFLFDSWDVGADNARIATETCQPDLGFGGPGTMAMEVCGDPLASGGTATLSIEGAPASSTVFIPIGLNASPTPFKGGTLVPVPVLLVVSVPADAGGNVSLPIPGGQGPVSVVIQAAAADGALPGGFALSNALQLDFLP
jgi:hypothetical protein